MENFKLISEHYSSTSETLLILGLNDGKYEVRIGNDEPFTLIYSTNEYHEAYAFAERYFAR